MKQQRRNNKMEYIEKIFKKTGWISILESVIFAILGAIVIWKPEGTVKAISFILAHNLLLDPYLKPVSKRFRTCPKVQNQAFSLKKT